VTRFSGQRRTALVLVLAAASWGLGTVLSKYALDEIPALSLLPIQLAASVAMLAVLVRRNRGRRPVDASPAIVGRLGLLNPGLAYTFTLLGLASISASLVVMIGAIEPVLILILATAFLSERVTPAMIVLSACALAGTLIVIYDPTSSGQAIGIVLTFAGVACCAVYTIIARRWIGTADSTVRVVAVQQAYALALAVVLFSLVALPSGRAAPPVSPLGWASAIASGLLYYAAAYWFYLTGLRAAPAFVAAAAFYLIPVFGVAASFVLLGDRFDQRQWLGMVVVILAVVALARTQAGEREPAVGSAAAPSG
jgi:drug/metabolite transporter (DMT)-like permease